MISGNVRMLASVTVDRIKIATVAPINLSTRRLDEVQCRLRLAQEGCRDAK